VEINEIYNSKIDDEIIDTTELKIKEKPKIES